MKLKRFQAPDTRTAMQQIKSVFGPDAVILSSHRVDGGVEIVAAIDFDENVLSTEAAVTQVQALPVNNTSQAVASPLDDMRLEIQTLRGMLEAQLRGHLGGEAPLHSVLKQKLLELGVSQWTAQLLVEKINPNLNEQIAWQQLLNHLSSLLPIFDVHRIEEGGIYAFVGPTGVGKTTTLAKIAARFVLRFGAEKLGLITMDTYRIAAQEQLLLYGKILGAEVCIAQDESSLARIIQQMNDKKLILIDTAGMNPSDKRAHQQMDLLSSQLRSISTTLVLPATSHYQVIMEAIRQYHVDRIEQCIVTKIDEAAAIGGIISAILETNIGVSYLTNGQRVPEDIKIATRHLIVEEVAKEYDKYFNVAVKNKDRLDLKRGAYVE